MRITDLLFSNHTTRKPLMPALMAFIGILTTGSLFAQAPTISYSTPQTYIAGGAVAAFGPTSTGVSAPAYSTTYVATGSGFNAPGGLAIDAAGNIYVADNGNNQIKKIPSGGGAIVIIGTGFSHPTDVKADAVGNVYVADTGDNTVKEILASNGSTITLASGFNVPSAIALDPAGNIYVADTQNNQVKKIPAGGGNAVNLGFTFNKPNCLATDAAGDLYIIDFNYMLYRIPAAGGPPVTWSGGFNIPKGMTVAASGDIYIAESGSGFIKRVPPAGGTAVAFGPQLSVPAGVAVGSSGNVIVAFNNVSLAKIKPVGGYYLSAPLPAGLSFAIATGLIGGTPTAITAAKNYTITAYNTTGSATATLNITVTAAALPTLAYSTPQTYTVGTAITALTPTSTGVANPGYSSTPVVVATGFNGPDGVALDAAGNVYVGDANNNAVKKIAAAGGTVTSIGSGFVTPRGVAVDASNNVYVADWGNAAVKKLTGGAGTPVIIGSGFSQPYGVAVDAAKNVYVADYSNKNVKEIPLGAGTPVTLSTGFVAPTDVAVDAVGNVYVDDSNASLVYKLPVTGAPRVIISSSLTTPYGVAVDGAGDLYLSDHSNNTLSVTAAGGSGFPTYIGSGFITPTGVAIDSKGNVFVADAGNNSIKKVKPVGGYYISPGLPAGLIFNSGTGVISGTPTAAKAATTYTVTAYSSGGSKSATLSITVSLPPLPAIAYSTPQSYLTGVAISPLAPSASGVAAVAYAAPPVSLGSGYNGPAGVAVDASGNVYVADVSNNAIKKIPSGGGTPVIIGSGFSFPRDVAVDAAGNVFVTDAGNAAVKEIPGGTGTPVTIGSGFTIPWGIAIDAKGNLYVSDISTKTVKQIPLVSGVYGTPVTLASGFASPYGVAVDAGGNVYVADANNNAVKMIAAGSLTVTSVGSGFGSVYGVRLDNAGNLYVTDKTYNVIKKLPAGSNTVDTVASGFNAPTGIAIGGAGVIYAADYNNNLVKKFKPIGGYFITPALPAGLRFATATGVISGTPTATIGATNFNVTGYNNAGGTIATVNIKVTARSPDANLTHLALSAGTLSPAFAPGTTSYTATVASSVPTMVITPTASSAFATITVNGFAVASGSASTTFGLETGPNPFTVVVTAQDGTTKSYSITITRPISTNASLAGLSISAGTLTPAFATATFSYTANVTYSTGTITVTPTASDANAAITVNNMIETSGLASQGIPLGIGSTTITIVVTAQDGATTKTYTITVHRPFSNVSTLSALSLSSGALAPVFAPGTTGYTATVANTVTAVTVTPSATDPEANVKVKGVTVPHGGTSAAIPLNIGNNVITVVVTAQDGTTTDTYTITVTRPVSPGVTLSSIGPQYGPLSPVFNSNTTSYTLSVSNTTGTMTIKPVTTDANATLKVNNTTTPSGATFGPIALAVGSNTISIIVTAQDGVTTQTYTITVTRATGAGDAFDQGISVTRPTETPTLAGDDLIIHQAVSPNGDGINDFLQIDNISQFPDNKLTIMNRGGQLIYEAKGYDNSSKVFDGHSNKNGQMQLPGTYFYQLDYTVNGIARHKTGFVMLKY